MSQGFLGSQHLVRRLNVLQTEDCHVFNQQSQRERTYLLLEMRPVVQKEETASLERTEKETNTKSSNSFITFNHQLILLDTKSLHFKTFLLPLPAQSTDLHVMCFSLSFLTF